MEFETFNLPGEEPDIESIIRALQWHDNQLMPVGVKLAGALDSEIANQEVLLDKVSRKIMQSAGRRLGKQDRTIAAALDKIYTGIHGQLAQNESLIADSQAKITLAGTQPVPEVVPTVMAVMPPAPYPPGAATVGQPGWHYWCVSRPGAISYVAYLSQFAVESFAPGQYTGPYATLAEAERACGIHGGGVPNGGGGGPLKGKWYCVQIGEAKICQRLDMATWHPMAGTHLVGGPYDTWDACHASCIEQAVPPPDSGGGGGPPEQACPT